MTRGNVDRFFLSVLGKLFICLDILVGVLINIIHDVLYEKSSAKLSSFQFFLIVYGWTFRLLPAWREISRALFESNSENITVRLTYVNSRRARLYAFEQACRRNGQNCILYNYYITNLCTLIYYISLNILWFVQLYEIFLERILNTLGPTWKIGTV